MSHSKERAEKVCLNCGALLHGRYCHQCGQENTEPKESVGHLIRHFFEDITHFDGKFFKTIKLLITKPGFLTSEYLAGHRARYLHPIRMYMFISFVFFFVSFIFFKMDDPKGPEHANITSADTTARYYLDSLIRVGKNEKPKNRIFVDTNDLKIFTGTDINGDTKPNNGVFEKLVRKLIKGGEAMRRSGNDEKATKELIEKFLHYAPQMLFIVMPFFALFLYLLYIRRRKEWNYVAHGIFTIHYYSFLFIGWFFILLAGLLPVGSIIAVPILYLGLFYYLYRAMRNFYKQSRWKTVLKFFMLNTLVFIVVILVSIAYLLAALANMAE